MGYVYFISTITSMAWSLVDIVMSCMYSVSLLSVLLDNPLFSGGQLTGNLHGFSPLKLFKLSINTRELYVSNKSKTLWIFHSAAELQSFLPWWYMVVDVDTHFLWYQTSYTLCSFVCRLPIKANIVLTIWYIWVLCLPIFMNFMNIYINSDEATSTKS